jgi:hypothetical protein
MMAAAFRRPEKGGRRDSARFTLIHGPGVAPAGNGLPRELIPTLRKPTCADGYAAAPRGGTRGFRRLDSRELVVSRLVQSRGDLP